MLESRNAPFILTEDILIVHSKYYQMCDIVRHLWDITSQRWQSRKMHHVFVSWTNSITGLRCCFFFFTVCEFQGIKAGSLSDNRKWFEEKLVIKSGCWTSCSNYCVIDVYCILGLVGLPWQTLVLLNMKSLVLLSITCKDIKGIQKSDLTNIMHVVGQTQKRFRFLHFFEWRLTFQVSYLKVSITRIYLPFPQVVEAGGWGCVPPKIFSKGDKIHFLKFQGGRKTIEIKKRKEKIKKK